MKKMMIEIFGNEERGNTRYKTCRIGNDFESYNKDHSMDLL